MNNIATAKESIKITRDRHYTLNGREVVLPDGDFTAAEVISPEEGTRLTAREIPEGTMCAVTVTTEDSFQAARRYQSPCVMNFANAHHPGGGFLLGANAQEEALCRCSTLYASISSETAAKMYRFNNTHVSTVESDYMLYSPNVCVFRNERCELIEEPFIVSVITVPAPNRFGAAMLASEKTVRETMLRRIRIVLAAAAAHGNRELVLGAWGCGAFGNDPQKVAAYFRQVIADEGFGRSFSEICFAIYGSPDSRNYTAFRSQLLGACGRE